MMLCYQVFDTSRIGNAIGVEEEDNIASRLCRPRIARRRGRKGTRGFQKSHSFMGRKCGEELSIVTSNHDNLIREIGLVQDTPHDGGDGRGIERWDDDRDR